METAPGVGLAASQVGVPVQLVVLRDGPERWAQLTEDERMARERYDLPFTVLANPALQPVGDGEQVSFYKGVPTFPGSPGWWPVTAAVRVEALDEHGEPMNRVFSGWTARIVQHEVDHVRGRLYLNRVETRSLSTIDSYARLWAGQPTEAAAASLGFTLR